MHPSFIGSEAIACTRWRYHGNAFLENVFCDYDLYIHDLENIISSWLYCRTYLCKCWLKSLHWSGAQICINIHPDAVPPIHAESYHVATDKGPLQVPVYF